MIPRFIHSDMPGAPAMSQAAGGGLPVLDAALITGFNPRTPSAVSVAANVATFTYASAHGYEDKCWVRTAGASEAALNTDRQCTVTSTTTLTVPAPGVADGPVSGVVETRVAPVGWERPFVSTNVAVYRSANIVGNRMYFRADDSNVGGTTVLRLRGYESMSSASVGVDPFPTVSQQASGVAVVKGVATPWAVVADDRTVYLYTGSIPQGAQYHGVVPFGDFSSYKPADAYASMCGGTNSSNGGTDIGFFTGGGIHYAARASNGIEKSPLVGCVGPNPGLSGRYRAYPSSVSGGATFSRGLHILDGVSNTVAVRGELRGLMYVHEAIPVSSWLVVPSVTGINGRVVVLAAGAGSVALRVDEDWE